MIDFQFDEFSMTYIINPSCRPDLGRPGQPCPRSPLPASVRGAYPPSSAVAIFFEVQKVYDHYAAPATPSPNVLQIPETKKRVKLNAARRDSGIGYSSEENSPTQSPLPTNEVKFKLPVTPETPKKV